MDAAVEVEGEVERWTDCLAQFRKAPHDGVDLLQSVKRRQLLADIHLHGRKAALGRRLRLGYEIGGAVAADPDIGLDAAALRAAEQRVGRGAMDLAEDIPERHVNA